MPKFAGHAANFINALTRRLVTPQQRNLTEWYSGIVPVVQVGQEWPNDQEAVYSASIVDGLGTPGTHYVPWISTDDPIWVHEVTVYVAGSIGLVFKGEFATLFTILADYNVLNTVTALAFPGLFTGTSNDRGSAIVGISEMPPYPGFAGITRTLNVADDPSFPAMIPNSSVVLWSHPQRPLLLPSGRFLGVVNSHPDRLLQASFTWSRAGAVVPQGEAF